MLGAIAGDIIGSTHERKRVTTRSFALFPTGSTFTDDTVLTAAVASALITARRSPDGITPDYHSAVLAFARKWPRAGYGGNFRKWIHSDNPRPYNSWGNGSAMRVSAVGFAFDDEATVLREAKRSASITHNHPEGIKAAQAVALGVLLARQGNSKEQIRASLTSHSGYDLDRTTEDIRPTYHFDVSAQKSVPEAIIAFLDSHDFESAIRNAIWLGGDADTQACISGALAEAYYGGVPTRIASETRKRFPAEILSVLDEFNSMTAILFGRLGVARRYQGNDYGAALVASAIKAARHARKETGGVFLAVDAKNTALTRWYTMLEFGFVQLDRDQSEHCDASFPHQLLKHRFTPAKARLPQQLRSPEGTRRGRAC